MMRNVALSIVVVTVALSIACGRANPRLAKITDKSGNNTSTTTFTYDGSGHATQVELKNDPLDELYELTFADGKLTTVKLTQSFTGAQTTKATTTSKYTYDADKLTTIDTGDETGAVEKTTFAYDANGHVTSVVTSELKDPQHAKTTTTLTYDASGAVTKDELTSESDAGKQTLASQTLTYADGRLAKIDVKSNDANGSVTTTYASGVLQQLTKDLAEQGGVVDKGTVKFTYDGNGRMTHVKDSAGRDVDYAYDDGDAADLDVTPNDLGFSFDLTGHAWNAPDAKTFAARLANLSW